MIQYIKTKGGGRETTPKASSKEWISSCSASPPVQVEQRYSFGSLLRLGIVPGTHGEGRYLPLERNEGGCQVEVVRSKCALRLLTSRVHFIDWYSERFLMPKLPFFMLYGFSYG